MSARHPQGFPDLARHEQAEVHVAAEATRPKRFKERLGPLFEHHHLLRGGGALVERLDSLV